jgi:sec-independent protein translocase protein TatA
MIGAPEIIFIVLIVLLLFGGKKIPELMKGMGKGVKMFKQGMNEMEEEVKRPIEDQPSQQPTEQQPNQDGK